MGIVNLQSSKGAHWVVYINEIYFDSYECSTSNKLSKFIRKRNRDCLFPEYKIRGPRSEKNFYCSAFTLYIIDLPKISGIDFKCAVLNLHYQRISLQK